MRSWLIFVALLVISTWLAQVEAAACAVICYTTELKGFAPGGVPGCTCSGTQQGARTGSGGCNCGQCYDKTQGVVYGYALNTDGGCTYGTDCGTCDYSTGSSTTPSGSTSTSGSTNTNVLTNTTSILVTATPSPAPATAAPSSAPATSLPSNSTTDTLSTSGGSATGSNSSSTSTDDSTSSSQDSVGNSTGSSHTDTEAHNNGLSTWQIVLAICCAMLIFIVAVVSVCACYCKARSRLYEHEEDQVSYYNQPPHNFQPWVANNSRTELPLVTKTANIV